MGHLIACNVDLCLGTESVQGEKRLTCKSVRAGNIDGTLDGLGTLDFHSRSGHHFAPQQHDSMIMAHHHALPIASNNALAGNLAAGFSHYFGHM